MGPLKRFKFDLKRAIRLTIEMQKIKSRRFILLYLCDEFYEYLVIVYFLFYLLIERNPIS